MNDNLKDLNKKIRFLNEAIQFTELFKPQHQQHIATALHQERALELTMTRHKVKLPLTVSKIEFLKQFLFFGEKTEGFKRTVKEDKLISIYAIEEKTKAMLPLSIAKFKDMTSKIIFY